MKILIILILVSVILTSNYERLSQQNTALLLVDHQTGLSSWIFDQDILDFKNSLISLAKISKIYNLSTIISASEANGPNGPTIPEILSILPNATYIKRKGEINAWDNIDFSNSVKKLNKTKIIVSGLVTDVCVAFLALSLRNEGYEVYVAIDSSGTYSTLVRDMAINRMIKAGVTTITWFGIASELQLDWRKSTSANFTKLLKDQLPFYADLISSWNSANSTSKST